MRFASGGKPNLKSSFDKTLDSLVDVSPILLVAFLAYAFMEFRALKREIRKGLARAEQRAKEDRERNERDHGRLFDAVAGLQSNVQVLLDRSDRPGAQGSGGPRE